MAGLAILSVFDMTVLAILSDLEMTVPGNGSCMIPDMAGSGPDMAGSGHDCHYLTW
jgi:hypothetical protein